MALLLAAGGGGSPVNYTLVCASGSYSYTGVDASLKVAHSLQCAAGSYSYSGVAASLKVAHSLVCDAGAYTYTGNAASLKVEHSLVCDAGAYAYTGVAASLNVAHSLVCDAGTYSYSGNDATLTYTPGAAQQPITGAGAGHPTGIWWGETKINKGKKLDAILKNAMQQIIEGDAEPELIAAKAVEIVKPFVEKKVKRDDAPKYKIDWAALEKDAKKVQELLSLWQEQLESLEDEEMLIMMMAN